MVDLNCLTLLYVQRILPLLFYANALLIYENDASANRLVRV